MVDETLPTTGWLHLIEHLALHDRARGTLTVNGSTSLLTTEFDMHGPLEDVVRLLGAVTSWLREPSLERLEEESKVLRAEAEWRGTNASATALLQRFGARGAGLAGSDVSEPLLPRVVDLVRSALRAVRHDALPESTLADTRSRLAQRLQDPYAAAAWAWRAAQAELRGEAVQTPTQVLDEIRQTSESDVRAVIDSFCESLLVGVPGRATWNDELPMLRMPTGSRATGSSHRSLDFPANRTVLTVGPQAVSIGADGEYSEVPYARVAGLLAFPDGGRQLVLDDGWGLAIEPTLWTGGAQAVATIDAALPPALHVPMPARDRTAIPHPDSAWQRWQAFLSGNPRVSPLVAVGVGAVVSVLSVVFPQLRIPVQLGLIAVVLGIIGWVQVGRRRTEQRTSETRAGAEPFT